MNSSNLAEPLLHDLELDGQRDESKDKVVTSALARVWWQQRLFEGGIALNGAGNIVQGVSVYWVNHGFESAFSPYRNPSETAARILTFSWLNSLWVALQAIGLLVLGVANLDANLYLRRRPAGAAIYAVSVILCNALIGFSDTVSYGGMSYWLPALPYMYLLLPCRFGQVLRMESAKLPRFTELFHYNLVLTLVARAGAVFYLLAQAIDSESKLKIKAAVGFQGVALLVVAATTALAYRMRRKHGDSLTLALNYSIAIYLLSIGLTTLLSIALTKILLDPSEQATTRGIQAGFWFVTIIPTVCAGLLLCFRASLYQWLAQRQLEMMRLEQEGPLHTRDGSAITAEHGNLAHVRRSIFQLSRDNPGEGSEGEGSSNGVASTAESHHALGVPSVIDGYVPLSVTEEGYTLLHLSVWNGHADAVKVLVVAGADVNTSTRLRRQSALMLAARQGRDECMTLLLQAGASVHQRASDESTSLMAALATGQIATLQVLLEHGAGNTQQRWMGMDLDIIARAARRDSVLPVCVEVFLLKSAWLRYHPTIIPLSSRYHPLSSHHHPAIIPLSSHHHPAIIPPSSHHHPAIIRYHYCSLPSSLIPILMGVFPCLT
jgi:hypothetical protein